MSEPLMNESYQRGWNRAATDVVAGTIVPFINLNMGEDYNEGYMAGQDHALFELSKLREEQNELDTK